MSETVDHVAGFTVAEIMHLRHWLLKRGVVPEDGKLVEAIAGLTEREREWQKHIAAVEEGEW